MPGRATATRSPRRRASAMPSVIPPRMSRGTTPARRPRSSPRSRSACRVVAGDVYHEGISQITADDIEAATRLGYVVKLLAIAERFDDGALAVRVHPAMVPAVASARQRPRQLQRGVRRGRRRRLAHVLRPRSRRAADGERGARRRHRCREQPAQGHACVDRDVRPGSHASDRRDECRVLHPARGRRSSRRPPCRHGHVRAARRLDPHRRAGRASATTPAWCSSRTPHERPTCRPRSTTFATSRS